MTTQNPLTTTNISDNNQNAATTKKKRRKKKKAKKPESSNLNPMQNIISTLHDYHGIKLKEIHVAMDQMWEKGLKYDVVEEVLAYIHAKKGGNNVKKEGDNGEMTSCPHKTVEKELGVEKEDKTVETREKKAETVNQKDSPIENVVKPSESVRDKHPRGHTNDTSPKEGTGTNDTSPTIMEKLSIVVNHHDLPSCIHALQEWIVKAATPSQLQHFLSSSFPKLSHRVFSNKSNTITPFYNLLCQILKDNFKSQQVHSTLASLYTVIQGEKDSEFSKHVVDVVVKQVSQLVLNRVQNHVHYPVSTSTTNNPLIKLMSLRESSKKRIQQVRDLLLRKGMNTSHTLTSSTSHEDTLLQFLLGRQYQDILNSKQTLKSISHTIHDTKISFSIEQESLSKKLSNYQSDLVTVQSRKETLGKELKLVLQEELTIQSNITSTTQKLRDLEDVIMNQADLLDEQLNQGHYHVKLQHVAEEVVKNVMELENNLKIQDENVDSSTNSFTFYLQQLQSYIESTWGVMTLLSNRILSIQAELQSLETEIQTCRGFQMVEHVLKLEKTIQTRKKDLEQDVQGVHGLKEEGQSVVHELIKCLEENTSIIRENNEFVRSILELCKKMGLSNCERLEQLVRGKDRLGLGMDLEYALNDLKLCDGARNDVPVLSDRVASPMSQVKPASQSHVSPVSQRQPCGWSTVTATRKSVPRTSFRDIMSEQRAV